MAADNHKERGSEDLYTQISFCRLCYNCTAQRVISAADVSTDTIKLYWTVEHTATVYIIVRYKTIVIRETKRAANEKFVNRCMSCVDLARVER